MPGNNATSLLLYTSICVTSEVIVSPQATHLSTTPSAPGKPNPRLIEPEDTCPETHGQPALVEEKHRRHRAQARSQEPSSVVLAPHRTSCCGTLGSLLDFSEVLGFLSSKQRVPSHLCNGDILLSAKWRAGAVITPSGPTHRAVLGSTCVESPLTHSKCKASEVTVPITSSPGIRKASSLSRVPQSSTEAWHQETNRRVRPNLFQDKAGAMLRWIPKKVVLLPSAIVGPLYRQRSPAQQLSLPEENWQLWEVSSAQVGLD